MKRNSTPESRRQKNKYKYSDNDANRMMMMIKNQPMGSLEDTFLAGNQLYDWYTQRVEWRRSKKCLNVRQKLGT